MPFEPVEPRRLYRRIADQIAALIASGELPAGSRLPAERDLARRLGVSRPSLREALIALEIDGLVEIRGGSGVSVRAPLKGGARLIVDAPGPFDIIAARIVVEPECAALAARAAFAARDAVARAFAQLEAATGTGRADIEADAAFHVAIASACGNPALGRMVSELWHDMAGPLAERLAELSTSQARRRENIGEHRLIAQAIERGEPAAARQAMRRHLLAVHRARLAALDGK